MNLPTLLSSGYSRALRASRRQGNTRRAGMTLLSFLNTFIYLTAISPFSIRLYTSPDLPWYSQLPQYLATSLPLAVFFLENKMFRGVLTLHNLFLKITLTLFITLVLWDSPIKLLLALLEKYHRNWDNFYYLGIYSPAWNVSSRAARCLSHHSNICSVLKREWMRVKHAQF